MDVAQRVVGLVVVTGSLLVGCGGSDAAVVTSSSVEVVVTSTSSSSTTSTTVAATTTTVLDTSEEAAIARIAAGEMLPLDTMHMIINPDQMKIYLDNGDWGVPSLLSEEEIPEDVDWLSRWAPHVNGGWNRLFEAEDFGFGIAQFSLNGFVFDTPEEARGFRDSYVAYMGGAVLADSVDGADAGAMIVYRDNIARERQYRSEGIAVRGNLAFWVIISTNDDTHHSGPMASQIAGFAVLQYDALRESAGVA